MTKKIRQYKDEGYTKLKLKETALIKEQCNLSRNKRVYILGAWNSREYFLCENKVFIVCFSNDKDKGLEIASLYTVTLNDSLDFETVLADDTALKFKEFCGKKIDVTRKPYTKEDFLIWCNSPSVTTEMVDIPNYKAIEFLQNYNKSKFRTDEYIFYAKRDKDFTWADNFYVYDIKNKAELKIYFNSCIQTFIPLRDKDVFVHDLSGKMSKYGIDKCRKTVIEFIKHKCGELNIENFYALEFIKQALQPIEKEKGWAVSRVFSGDFEFENIWVDDTLMYNREPYFILTDGIQGDITKAAAIDFFKAEYKSAEPYISRYFKRNHWNVDVKTLKRLTAFLKEPFDYKKTFWYKKSKKDWDMDDIKTNWQWLIAEFNRNSAKDNNELPLDLPMPDYTKLKKYTS